MIGILIIARLGSTRLKRKHLIEAGDKSFLEWLISRIQFQFKEELLNNDVKIVIATSDEPQNKEFETISSKLGCEVFYGNIHNIPQRQFECAKHFNFSSIISVDGDDILCSTEAMKKVALLIETADNEMVKTTGLPLGMNVTGYKTTFLQKTLEKAGSIKMLETGWGTIFKGTNSIIYDYSVYEKEVSNIRMTLDYALDADFFKKVIEENKQNMHSIPDSLLIETILNNKYDQINSSLNEEYWNNFNKEKQQQN
jgi:spore coat polysaccharide biosynthesis protein SpsF